MGNKYIILISAAIILLISIAKIAASFWLAESGTTLKVINVGERRVVVPILERELPIQLPPVSSPYLYKPVEEKLAVDIQAQVEQRRQERINKVEAFLAAYNNGESPLRGYGHILVDQAEACGGDYRILIGIAGSESGLGRIMYKQYNPFGYLDGVTYPDQATALRELSCKVSAQHIARCGDDLYCLARRYGGPETDLDLFVSKVRWFAERVS